MERPILRRRVDGYDVHCKNDGVDYWRIVKACLDENIDQEELIRNAPAKPVRRVRRDGLDMLLTPLVYTNPKRMVFRLDADGRTYVLKRARMGTAGFKRLLPWTSGVTYYTRVMLKVNRAVRAGFTATQDYFLVAERPVDLFRQEVWVLLEYLEGESLGDRGMDDRRRLALTALVDDLFRHGLTMDDLTLHNFLVHGEALRAIDISCRPFTRMQAEKMRIKMKTRYGVDLPVRGLGNTVIHGLLLLRYRLRRALGGAGAE